MPDAVTPIDDDLAKEIAELVTRPGSDILEAAPFNRAAMDIRTTVQLADGYTRYQAGPFSVEVSPAGFIAVRHDDWLSKFAQAIEGTTAVAGKFARVDGNAIVPIPDENLIETGELLVYLPRYRAKLAEHDGLTLRFADVTAKPKPFDPKRSVEDLLRLSELQRQSESGEIADRTLEQLRWGDLQQVDPQQISLPDFYARAGLGLLRAGFSAGALQGIRDFLAEDPDLPGMSEETKQRIFRTDARKTTRILTWEFISGKGPTLREFNEDHPITWDVRDGRIGA